MYTQCGKLKRMKKHHLAGVFQLLYLRDQDKDWDFNAKDQDQTRTLLWFLSSPSGQELTSPAVFLFNLTLTCQQRRHGSI